MAPAASVSGWIRPMTGVIFRAWGLPQDGQVIRVLVGQEGSHPLARRR